MIDSERIESLSILENKINYIFNDKNLLNNAFVHKSYTNENSSLRGKSNERLEFLGDAVLELVYTKILYSRYKNKDEGYLTKLRANLVCEKSFSEIADILELPNYLLLGKGEELTGGREKPSIKADLFEAFIGALYQDAGFDFIYNFILGQISDRLDEIGSNGNSITDYKSYLQELIHKKYNVNCIYVLSNESGPSHDKEFIVDVFVEERKIGSGIGKNKKQAQQMAAKDALVNLNVI